MCEREVGTTQSDQPSPSIPHNEIVAAFILLYKEVLALETQIQTPKRPYAVINRDPVIESSVKYFNT